MKKLLSLEWTSKISCGKKHRNNQCYDYYLIRLVDKDSMSASKISDQQILLTTITRWIPTQRYFRRNTNEQVLETLLDNKEVFEHALEQFDLELNFKSELEPIIPPTSKKRKHMHQLKVP